ncbi:MAG: amidohydrolase [bacterium]|nr:amidohydrolase [bacterium]
MANDTRHYKIIRGGWVLNPDDRRAGPADILLDGDCIAEIGPTGKPAPENAETIDASDRLLIAGLINAHTHSHGGLAKGSGDRWTLELLLHASRWISGFRSVEHTYLSALVGALEMVRKGCTACYDLYLELPLPTCEGLETIGRAYQDVGMRAVLAPMLADYTFYQAIPGLLDALPPAQRRDLEQARMQPAATTLAACRTLLQHVPFDPDRIRLALAPTIPLHCSDAFMLATRDLAQEYGTALHMHLGESKIQAMSGITRYGKTLTAHLDALGLLGPQFTAAHAVWLDHDDIQRLADNGASVAHNPGSNLRLGSGIAAIHEMVQAGVNVGIGTDGSSCSDNQNVFEAMRLASFVSRLRHHDYHTWLRTDQALHMATAGGARALGFEDLIGRLAPGYKADIVLLDLNHVNFLPLNDPINQLVHTEDGSAVDSVIINGEVVLWQGRFTRIDIASVRSQIDVAVDDLARLSHEARQLAEALEDHVGQFCMGLARQPYHVHAMAGAAY